MRTNPFPMPGWVKADEREPEEPRIGDLLLRLGLVGGAIAALVVASWLI